MMGGGGSRRRSSSSPSSKPAKNQEAQVLDFQKSLKGQGKEPDMTRDLYSVPKSEDIETMAEHLQDHKQGDLFPYVSVFGVQNETKDSRLARLRAYTSPYGKITRPEIRINGIALIDTSGTLQVQHLKEYVNKENLSKEEKRQNRRFQPMTETTFSKPYIQIARITGEFVPMVSSTSDYTDLAFTLEDGRLLDHQVIAQSSKHPSNQNGVFELSCDYCISTKDLDQLSIKYSLARNIMREGFQWGSISLTIQVNESDTPYMSAKVEAMAIVRMPYSTLEEQTRDTDHTDVVFTSNQVKQFRELYKNGDIADIDEPKKVRTLASSYSKSSIRKTEKSIAGPEHLGNQSGWEHLKGMRKPNLVEGIASISAISDDEDDLDVNPITKMEYEKQQALLRETFRDLESPRSDSTIEMGMEPDKFNLDEIALGESSAIVPKKSSMKKTRFQNPNTENVFQFD